MIDARVTMPRPMMKATTGFAWCAGTSSTGGGSTAEGVGAARLEADARTDDELMAGALQQGREPRRAARGEEDEAGAAGVFATATTISNPLHRPRCANRRAAG